jgi:hypothetical protein
MQWVPHPRRVFVFAARVGTHEAHAGTFPKKLTVLLADWQTHRGSHPCDKNKNVARMGHPLLGWESCAPDPCLGRAVHWKTGCFQRLLQKYP